ncbi:MAG: GIY-YIG nuclease family protein [Lachnospiraceae bacterium]|nr:GIY-YIG nuclease family protein [Lachnospiraceae bacterium]
MEESKGVIYILTNPSFKEYVKIGYADDIEKRLQQLNRSECIPFAFRVYATYEVDCRLSDLKIHSIIDKLNPNLRSIDNFNGQKRVREFYAMSPEDAYSILEAIAEIHNRTDKLKLVEPDAEAQNDESIAEEIQTETRIRGANFTFSEWEIPVGAVLEYYKNPDIKCTVVDDRKVEYEGEIMFLTSVAKKIIGKQNGIAGPRYFKYKGTELWDIEGRNC